MERDEWKAHLGTGGWVHEDGSVCGEYLAPPASAPPAGYWCTTHQMHVTHPGATPVAAPTKED
jgi:hypothetical protein